MSQPMGFFGLRVEPGEIVPLNPKWDVRITNIAFGETIKGYARTVVKVHRARLLDDFDDFDDLDDEDEDEDEDEEEDEEDEKEAELITEAADAKTKSKLESSNTAAEEDDEEEDDEDDDDDDDDEDNDEDDDDDDDDGIMIEEDYVVCSLYPEKIEHSTVDLEFSTEENIGFSVSGENAVELVGYYVASEPFDDDPDSDELDEFEDDEDDDEYDSDEMAMYEDLEGESDSEEDEDEDLDDMRIQEIEREAPASSKKSAVVAPVVSKKRAAEEQDTSIAEADLSQLSKNQRKKLNKKAKLEGGDKSADVEVKKVEIVQKHNKDGNTKVQSAKEEIQKKDGVEKKGITLPSGLIIEEKKVGSGPQAKAGNRVGMRYIGRLLSGKKFDSNTSGKPFKFKLGKGEVIAGWDEGVKGMRVGGERKLTIPAKMAYGSRGAPPDIPPNSTLVFELRLVDIN